MRKYLKIIIISAVSISLLSSCVKYSFNEPDELSYNPDIEANTTIEDLKMLHTTGLYYIDTDLIISGTVIANDKSGNLYKAIIIQDSTAGIEISLNAYELHNNYHEGDLIFVKCKGLYLGEYGEVVKLGSIYEGAIGRIEEPLIEQYLVKSDGGIPIVPKEYFIQTPNESYVNQLIVINNVQFSINSLGNTFADADHEIDGEYALENCEGSQVLVRTSGYADFARDTLPTGNGQIIAVLGEYNGEKQILIRDVNEVTFDNNRCGAVFHETFEGDLGLFTPYSVIGDGQIWEYDSQFDCAVMSGYDGSDHANEDWLISTSVDLTEYSDLVLNFRHTFGYFTSFNDMKVFICDDFDGSSPVTSGSWTELTGFNYPPSGSFWEWTDSGDIDISDYAGKPEVFIAFKYISTNTAGCTWEIDNIKISVN